MILQHSIYHWIIIRKISQTTHDDDDDDDGKLSEQFRVWTI